MVIVMIRDNSEDGTDHLYVFLLPPSHDCKAMHRSGRRSRLPSRCLDMLGKCYFDSIEDLYTEVAILGDSLAFSQFRVVAVTVVI